jgi:hypothetical protein
MGRRPSLSGSSSTARAGQSETGPVHVVGQDVYGLDADDDGVGCE